LKRFTGHHQGMAVPARYLTRMALYMLNDSGLIRILFFHAHSQLAILYIFSISHRWRRYHFSKKFKHTALPPKEYTVPEATGVNVSIDSAQREII